MVDHTQCDALQVALEAVMKSTPTHVKVLSKAYVVPDEEEVWVHITPEAKARIFTYAKQLKVSAKALINAVMTVFLRAALASFWQNNRRDFHEIKSKFPDFIFTRPQRELNLPRAKAPHTQTRGLSTKYEGSLMRYHNYMNDFLTFMKQYGGIEKYLNKNVVLDIHTHPLPGNVGRDTTEDVAIIDGNECQAYWVRLWKRGRGYNITIHGYVRDINPDGPQLEVGTVFRLYAIYRNIDWSSIHLKE